MLRPARLYIYHLLCHWMPETSCFALKRALLRWAGAEIGRNVRICSSTTILGAGNLSIGEDTWIGQNVLVVASGTIEIGDHVDVGPLVYLGNGTHEIDPVNVRSAGNGVSREIVIESGCWLGARATVLPGVRIGRKTVVGAGALVNKDLPPEVVAVGLPGRELKKLS